jgi:putative hydrolase of the HAD superfamily
MGNEKPGEKNALRAVLFDYGGVLAAEGFRTGLKAIARRFGLDPQQLYAEGTEAVYASGYVLGKGSERDFWGLLCRRTGLPEYREGFTEEILRHFVLRPHMLRAVRSLRQKGLIAAILSDQTDWLDRL